MRHTIHRRQLIYLAILALAVFLLLPHLLGFDRTIRLLRSADPRFLLLALAAESTRYLASAASTRVLARLFKRVIPFFPTAEAFFAGSALNRTFSAGGAPGMIVRLAFLSKEEISAGGVAAIFLIEDIIGLAIGSIVFAVGIGMLISTRIDGALTNLVIGFSVGSLALVLAGLYILHNRPSVERIIHVIARGIDRIVNRFLHRSVFTTERVQHGLDDFYAGLTAAQLAPRLVVISFLYNAARYVAGAFTLYFAFQAFHQTIELSALILLYTTVSVLSTASAIPGEVAIMGTGFAVLFLAFGIPRDIAFVVLVLARAIAFWLPLPIGYAMLWHMRRKHYL